MARSCPRSGCSWPRYPASMCDQRTECIRPRTRRAMSSLATRPRRSPTPSTTGCLRRSGRTSSPRESPGLHDRPPPPARHHPAHRPGIDPRYAFDCIPTLAIDLTMKFHIRSASRPALAPAIGGTMPVRRLWISLGVIAAALVFRVGHAQYLVHHGPHTLNDAFWYGSTALELQVGQFFRVPFATMPTAARPPLTTFLPGVPVLVAGIHLADGVMRMTMPVLGTARH